MFEWLFGEPVPPKHTYEEVEAAIQALGESKASEAAKILSPDIMRQTVMSVAYETVERLVKTKETKDFINASIKDAVAGIDFYPMVQASIGQEVHNAIKRINFSGEKLPELVAKKLENAILARMQEDGSYREMMAGVADKLQRHGDDVYQSNNVPLGVDDDK